MKVLVTGSNGFVGKNLITALEQIQNGNDKTRPNLHIDKIYKFDVDTPLSSLNDFCRDCDFVFNLVGVNRPKTEQEFVDGNFNFLVNFLKILTKYDNHAPIMLSSSIQASLVGRYANSTYGKSKYAAEQLVFEYGRTRNIDTYVYRFPNIFGKWSKPNYNSVIATFCYNYANDLPIQVNNKNVLLELLYIDDLVSSMLDLLEGKYHKCHYNDLKVVDDENGPYCYVKNTHKVTLQEIVDDLDLIKKQPKTLIVPEIKEDSFIKKLYSTYLSYLPKEKVVIDLDTKKDNRGSFTELLKTQSAGQFSINVTKPGQTKGNHFHNSKWEFFIVIKGKALIKQRNINTGETYEFTVTDNKLQAVHMLPGYTHSITNLDSGRELITLMWANENFDQNHPDTYYKEV